MFASLGTGTLLGFTAAIFHLLTHACFKALLFLGAGSVMHSMGGVIDMRRFGGLRRIMPITAATFLVGSLALAGVAPFAGFFSKDEILAALHGRGWPAAHGEHHDTSSGGSHAGGPPPMHPASVTPDAAELPGHLAAAVLDVAGHGRPDGVLHLPRGVHDLHRTDAGAGGGGAPCPRVAAGDDAAAGDPRRRLGRDRLVAVPHPRAG
jgi:hypothetical protein